MSKRGPPKTTLKKRKRKKNGISSSSSVLELVDTSKPQLMQVWHTNVEDPFVSQQSVVSIPSEPQLEQMNTGAEGEDVDVTVPVVVTPSKWPKRKRGNNSVSHSSSNDFYRS